MTEGPELDLRDKSNTRRYGGYQQPRLLRLLQTLPCSPCALLGAAAGREGQEHSGKGRNSQGRAGTGRKGQNRQERAGTGRRSMVEEAAIRLSL